MSAFDTALYTANLTCKVMVLVQGSRIKVFRR
jgi:hypothetical protein